MTSTKPRLQLQTLGHWIYLIIWLVSGTYFFWYFRFGFGLIPSVFLLPLWLFLGFIWIGVQKWKAWAILIVPVFAMATCFPLTMLISALTEWELERTLDGFIQSAQNGAFPATMKYDGEAIRTLKSEFSQDYAIVATDYLLGGYDYWVHFATGARYHITLYSEGGNQWSIVAFNYAGEP